MDSAGQPPPHKRARILAARGEDDYMHGNITMIEVHNFMTYSHIATKPGPRLNLVIGPNGTGKSSLVCAIAIGLGGEPQLLGRAGHIGDYVKQGEESGWIKISLRGHSPDETIVITRKINRQNKSEWLLNGKPASKRLVQETVQQFNIQVGNLTQFLPQDRVCEFAKMSPVQLLEETEKAVGDPELSQQHCTLSRRNYELKQHQVSVRQLENTLNQHKANNAELEKDVERVQQRNRLYERAEAMKKKLPWLKYDREKHTYMDAKEREKEAKKKLQEAMKQIVELKAPIEEKKHRKVKLENTCKKLRDENSRNESKCKEIGRKENELRVQVKAKRSEIEELHRSEATRQEKIRNAERAVAEAEEELANLPITEPPREEIEQLGGRIHDLELAAQEKRRCIQERTGFQNQKKAQIDHCNRRLAEVQNVTNQRLQLLKNSGAQKIFEAYQWVEQHRHEFRRDVYGPVLLEVNVPNKDLAAYVEGHVAYYIWKAFITQDGEDRDLLVRNLKQYDVPIINFTGEESQVPGPSITPQMESLGIEGRLDQVISAPQVVKDVLIGQFALNHSFIGTAETNRRADEACRLGIRDLWTPENHFRWQDSRYGGPMSASVNPVRAARLFSPSVDTRELNELERKKTEAVETLERQRDELKTIAMELRQHEDQAAVLHKQREEIVNRVKLDRKKRQDLKNKIEQRKRKLESFEKEEDLQSAEHRLRNAVANLNEKRCMKALELKDLLVQSVNDQILYNVRYLAAAELDANVKAMEKEFRAHEAVGIQSQQDYDACKAEFASCRARLEAAKDAAEKIARITPELQASFENMPNTVEDLEDAIEDCIAQARTVLCPNPNVLEEYERRYQQITDASAKLEVEKAALDSCSEEIERIQTVWLTKLREIVTKINSTFSRNFKQMAVAGEVTLDEQGMDFDRYGIHIKVKFRETGELQVLSAHHQSGGERSVSTILYLVSLQDLTHCPFRVVDEINQGMDPINERKMFQQLVKAASQPNTPQCFLLTPKLLPELDYSEACSILDIMNGPWIQRASEVWSSGDCWSEVSRTTIRPVS